jgi:hypothetical protein
MSNSMFAQPDIEMLSCQVTGVQLSEDEIGALSPTGSP